MITKSPSLGGLTLAYYLYRFVRQGRYAWIHLFKKLSSRGIQETCLLQSLSWIIILKPSCRKWLGVNGSGSKGSADTWVSGRKFKINSTCKRKVNNSSSFGKCDHITHLKTVFTDLANIFQQPPMCGACGVMNFHWIPCLTTCCSIWTLYRAFI